MAVKKAVKKNVPTKKVAITKGKEKVREVEMPVSDIAELQDGIMPTNSKVKDKPPVGMVTIGMSLGATINVGDYQSARIDVFIQRNVIDNDDNIRFQYENLSDMLQKEIERQSAILLDE